MVGPERPLWVNTEAGPVRNPDLTDEEFTTSLDVIRAQNLDALWCAARDYQEASISGAAIGLLTISVLRGLPKAVAVQNWITSVWGLYYQRKPLITHEWSGDLMDFNPCGPMPFTVPELMAENGM
jgi:hypothetical protein